MAQGKVAAAFIGFSLDVSPAFRDEILARVPGSLVAVDPPGSPGEVVRRLADRVKHEKELYTTCRVFICGPDAMMKATVNVLKDCVPRKRIFTAREDMMRCGIGVCGSCGTPSGLRSCVDGPVISPEP